MNEYAEDETISIRPLKAFPIMRDLVPDVSWNYEQNKRIAPFKPDPSSKNESGDYVMMQEDIDRVQEFRKCIECYLCQNVCHVLRDHERKDAFVGPRFMIRLAGLEMHPLDMEDRIPDVKNSYGSGMCNITRCCTDVCPEHIQITDNGIIPMKERVVDRYYDPVMKLIGLIFRRK
jgi:succinate dehydrogenase / fumarate reductase iron-sulfur subunit